MFSNSSQIVVSGGVFNHFEGKLHSPNGLHKGLEILYSKVATGALHNSGERFDPPKCHPNTRTAILNEIMDWLNETSVGSARSFSSSTRVNSTVLDNSPQLTSMWINGPAGAGKSAIAQSIAQMCFELGQLSSTFFFSRTSEMGRRDERRLMATLAYQIMKHIPETQPFISAAVLNDPLVFNLSLESQMEALIVKPLSYTSCTLAKPSKPKIMIIDGLDECLDIDAQRVIVEVFVMALARIQHKIPHKLLILSRPEPHLVSIFGERKFRPFLRRLTLDDSWEPDEDIRLFLTENLENIKKSHPLSRLLTHWPPDSDIEELIRRSSGQFVYVSTVVKALKSERHHPIEVLKDILSLRKLSKNQPYAELDALYDHIFSKLEDPDTVLRILRIALARSIVPPIVLRDPLKTAQCVLGLPDGILEINLNDLSAVVSVTRTMRQTDIKFLHASLPDYLIDESRSGKFFINSEDICVDLTKRCMDFVLENHNRNVDHTTAYHLRMAFSGSIHFAHHVQDRRLDIYHMLSELDLSSTLSLAAEKGTFQAPGLLGDITEFIVWGLKEYQRSSPSNRVYLSKFVERVQQWIFTRLEEFPFNEFDNDIGLDLTVFAMSPTSLLRNITSKGVFNTLIDISRDVIQANGNNIQIPDELGNELALCWSLMPGLATFFEDSDFAGRYTMTPKRYCDAAVLCFNHLLREGPPIKRKGDEKWLHTRYNYLQAMKYATFFLIKAEARGDLYDLCRKLLQIPNEKDDNPALYMADEDHLHSIAFMHIDKLIARLEEKTGGSENPWSCDVTLASGLAISVGDYLLKTCKLLPLPNAQGEYLSMTSEELRGPSPHLQVQLVWAPNTFGVHPWTRSSTTMRWFWWYEINVLRWIKPDRSSSIG